MSNPNSVFCTVNDNDTGMLPTVLCARRHMCECVCFQGNEIIVYGSKAVH